MDYHRGQRLFSLPRVVPCFPLLGLTPSGLFMGLSSTIIYFSELILCCTIFVPSATRHNIHMYPYLLFAANYHLKSSPTFSVRPYSSVGRVTVDLIQRSWVRFPPRSIFFLLRVVPCFPLLGLTPSGLFMGLSSTIIYTSVNSLFHHLCSQCYAAQHSYVPLLTLRRELPSSTFPKILSWRVRLSLSE